jgi:uncharacterized protein (TIRG00374 family)
VSRYRYAIGGLLGLLLTILAVVVIAVRAEEMPRVASVWPLLLALGVSVVAWWLQGLISAVLARPQLKSLHVRDMTRIYLAGAFIGGISPIRGAEIPYEVYLLRRLGLSAGEGSTVIIAKGLLNVSVLTLGALAGLFVTSKLPKVENLGLIMAALAVGGIWALAVFLLRRRARRRLKRTAERVQRPGWRAKVSNFFRDMRRSFTLLWHREHRTTIAYSTALMLIYWAFRLSFGPLSLMAAGWSGDWVPVVLAQLFLSSFILPLAPTPGGSGATELSFVALLSAYATQSQLLSGVIIYSGLTHYLPTVVGAFFTGRQLWQGVGRDE